MRDNNETNNNMDFTPTYDQREYLEAAVAFADDALKPHAAPLDKEHEFPMPTIKLTQWGSLYGKPEEKQG